MPIIVVSAGTQAVPTHVNQYHDLLTGVLNDTPLFFKYTPGNNTNAVLGLQGDGSADLLRGYKSDGATEVFVIDASGNATFKTISTQGGGLTLTSLTVNGTETENGNLTVTGTATLGNISSDGGKITTDGSGNLAATGYMHLGAQDSTGATRGGSVARFQGFFSALDIYCDSSTGNWSIAPAWGGSGNARGLTLFGADGSNGTHAGITIDGNGNLHVVNGVIQSSISFLGFKDSSGNKIGEMKNGSFIIGGHAIANGDGTGTTTFGAGSFDGFDLGELYPTDATYPGGTVVCPNAEGVFVRCTHDKCPYAMIVSATPGIGIGQIDDVPNHQYLALTGRMLVDTQDTALAVMAWVTSDGAGGVRGFVAGESGHALGYVIAPSTNGQVGIVVRPMMYQG